jgi:putative ABC transport system permease protein
VDGIPVRARDLGPITASEVTRGRFFTAADATANHASVSTSYASQLHLAPGSTVTVDGTSLRVVGLVNSSSSVSIYIPLHVAQTLANLPGQVTQIDMRASSATITTSRDLANEITGSLTSVSTLINKLGLWLAVAVLIVAFGIATLLTMSAVSRRVRDFGTLKALGWPVRRIVTQVMAESLVQGAIGGILGIALGYGGAALLTSLLAHLDLDARNGPGSDATIYLTAPVQPEALILAVGLAVAGGLIAGGFGGWRAAALRPAVALRRVE